MYGDNTFITGTKQQNKIVVPPPEDENDKDEKKSEIYLNLED
eukprot:CAMPEP_0176345792 /NCGR_PEP_ID=MMETSP0126-20121128/5744_1 /TAXON_ID=141414 ORGANISM="Strombidinopsis acuminatum, Strain SPMC142" /NCGR_SAMPLE_ID=MMETSP0126 /ASSEMBLY_ACC=CAM_ASM_000229 /LENGTH=41 /DNA_ID= /DNA_START= /DNA_END= /DNA_ORIENTATION=